MAQAAAGHLQSFPIPPPASTQPIFPHYSSLLVLNPSFPSLGFAHGKTLKAGAESVMMNPKIGKSQAWEAAACTAAVFPCFTLHTHCFLFIF